MKIEFQGDATAILVMPGSEARVYPIYCSNMQEVSKIYARARRLGSSVVMVYGGINAGAMDPIVQICNRKNLPRMDVLKASLDKVLS